MSVFYLCECRCPQRPEDGIRSPGTGVTNGFETPDVDTGHGTWVLLEEQNTSLATDLSLHSPSFTFERNKSKFMCTSPGH